MSVWLDEAGGADGTAYSLERLPQPRPVFVRDPRRLPSADARQGAHEGHGELEALLHPAQPGQPSIALVRLNDGRHMRVSADWCADTANLAPLRILPAPRATRASAAAELESA